MFINAEIYDHDEQVSLMLTAGEHEKNEQPSADSILASWSLAYQIPVGF